MCLWTAEPHHFRYGPLCVKGHILLCPSIVDVTTHVLSVGRSLAYINLLFVVRSPGGHEATIFPTAMYFCNFLVLSELSELSH